MGEELAFDLEKRDYLQRIGAWPRYRCSTTCGVETAGVKEALNHTIIGGAAAVCRKLATTMRAGIGEGEKAIPRPNNRDGLPIDQEAG